MAFDDTMAPTPRCWKSPMTEIEQIEQRVRNLSPGDLAAFRAWFIEFDQAAWDAQIEADARAGKLDHLVAEALADYRSGQTRPLRQERQIDRSASTPWAAVATNGHTVLPCR
jgi:hypothetical protein